jgi:hypothetical protein
VNVARLGELMLSDLRIEAQMPAMLSSIDTKDGSAPKSPMSGEGL